MPPYYRFSKLRPHLPGGRKRPICIPARQGRCSPGANSPRMRGDFRSENTRLSAFVDRRRAGFHFPPFFLSDPYSVDDRVETGKGGGAEKVSEQIRYFNFSRFARRCQASFVYFAKYPIFLHKAARFFANLPPGSRGKELLQVYAGRRESMRPGDFQRSAYTGFAALMVFRGVEAHRLLRSVSRERSPANLGPGAFGSWRSPEAEPLVHPSETWSHPRGTLGRCHKGSEINIQRIKNRLPGIPGKPVCHASFPFTYSWNFSPRSSKFLKNP